MWLAGDKLLGGSVIRVDMRLILRDVGVIGAFSGVLSLIGASFTGEWLSLLVFEEVFSGFFTGGVVESFDLCRFGWVFLFSWCVLASPFGGVGLVGCVVFDLYLIVVGISV